MAIIALKLLVHEKNTLCQIFKKFFLLFKNRMKKSSVFWQTFKKATAFLPPKHPTIFASKIFDNKSQNVRRILG
jgi:hypothetical protein